MTPHPDASRPERIQAFLRRLEQAPPASDHDEAIRQIADILRGVEDEMTSIPFDETFPLNDGRMYPPLLDNQLSVPGRTDVACYRNRGHYTWIGDNGAIQIQIAETKEFVLDKPGTDGRSIGRRAQP